MAQSHTHGGLALSGLGSADRQGVGINLADLPLWLTLGLRLWRGRSSLRHAPFSPVLLPLHSCCTIDKRHAIRTHQPLQTGDTK